MANSIDVMLNEISEYADSFSLAEETKLNNTDLYILEGLVGGPVEKRLAILFLKKRLIEFYTKNDISKPVRDLLLFELSELNEQHFVNTKFGSMIKDVASKVKHGVKAAGNNSSASHASPSHPNVKYDPSIGDKIGDKIDMIKQGLRDHWKGISDFYHSHQGVIDIAAMAAVAYGAYKLAKYLYKKSHPDATPEQVDSVAKQAQIKELKKVMASCSRSQDPEQCRKKVQEKINKIQGSR